MTADVVHMALNPMGSVKLSPPPTKQREGFRLSWWFPSKLGEKGTTSKNTHTHNTSSAQAGSQDGYHRGRRSGNHKVPFQVLQVLLKRDTQRKPQCFASTPECFVPCPSSQVQHSQLVCGKPPREKLESVKGTARTGGTLPQTHHSPLKKEDSQIRGIIFCLWTRGGGGDRRGWGEMWDDSLMSNPANYMLCPRCVQESAFVNSTVFRAWVPHVRPSLRSHITHLSQFP